MGSGRTKIRRILEWQIWSRWREINTQVFCDQVSEDRRDPRKHIDTVISREVMSALKLRAETTFLLVPLSDLKKKRRKKKKKEWVLFKNILLLSPFFLDIWLSTASKIYYL